MLEIRVSSLEDPSEGNNIAPGATAFTLISGASSLARDFVRVSKPPFAIEYIE